MLIRTVGICAGLVVIAVGCRTASNHCSEQPAAMQRCPAPANRPQAVSPPTPEVALAINQPPAVAPVAFQQLLASQNGNSPTDVPPGSTCELSLPWLIAEVEARNPSLQAMVAAWRAASERYPQVVSLDDPMFMAMAAPASFDSNTVESAYVLQGSQKLPWFGKRAARGRQSQSEASAAFQDVADSRVKLVEITEVAFLDYFLVSRQLDLNRQNVEIVKQFRDAAESRYKTNRVTQQDLLQADVELANLERRQIELERMNKVSAARINTLLLVPPDAPLPPPPRQLEVPTSAPEAAMLRQIAIQQRPDLAALAARIRAEQAAVTLACKERYPDVEVFGRYDSFWQPASTQGDLRGQVGTNLNVPIYYNRLNAAVREAMSRVSQRRAEYQQRLLDVEYEVQSAYEQYVESLRALQLYSEKLVPTTEQNVAAARSNYDVGKSTFLELAVAQRQLIDVREKQQELIANAHRYWAELKRSVGGTLPQEAALPPSAMPEVIATPPTNQ